MIVREFGVGLVREDRLFQASHHFLNQTGHYVRIADGLQVVVVAAEQLTDCLFLLVNCDRLAENSLLAEEVRSRFQVHDHHLQQYWHTDIAGFIFVEKFVELVNRLYFLQLFVA